MKTNFLIFHQKSKKILNHGLSIKIDNQNIERVTSKKNLGMMIDEKLSWKNHIDYVAKKLSKTIGICMKVREVLPKQTLTNLYYTFV